MSEACSEEHCGGNDLVIFGFVGMSRNAVVSTTFEFVLCRNGECRDPVRISGGPGGCTSGNVAFCAEPVEAGKSCFGFPKAAEGVCLRAIVLPQAFPFRDGDSYQLNVTRAETMESVLDFQTNVEFSNRAPDGSCNNRDGVSCRGAEIDFGDR